MDLATSAQRESATESLAEAFFSRPPYPEPEDEVVTFDDWQLPPMSASERLAMFITLGTVICGALAGLALLAF